MPDRATPLTEVVARFAAGHGFALATIDLDHPVKLRKSVPFFCAYSAQDLVVADGNPIVWLAHLARRPVQLLPGSDLVFPVCQIAMDLDLTLVFLGRTSGVLDGAEARLRDCFPGPRVVLKIARTMGFVPQGPLATQILEGLAPLGPALCCAALGAPKQEILAACGRMLAPQIGFASVGAGLDFLSDHQLRAPSRVRLFPLEWLWRALSAPAT